ncbi:MFS transporter [Bacillus weihaiensis]|uniref:MFS transporter n=1 Tax=Bacillus weihaiensis TaxID=1547283 RepID=UPI00235664E3|nr:MFS transporter [Bacillus weihaiensis]
MKLNKNIWILLIGEFIAGFGLWLGIIGDLEFMQDKIPSDFLKSLILVAGIFAGILCGPLAGKLTDQYSKKTILLYSGAARLISVSFMFLAIYTGSVWWMVVFLISINMTAAFYFPALQAAIPLVVDKKDLLQLNGLHTNISTLSRILGTAAAGFFLTIMSLTTLYVLAFSAYFILFVLTWFLQMDESKALTECLDEGAPSKQSFHEVFPVIKQQPLVLMTLVLSLVPILFIGGFNLVIIALSEIQQNPSLKGWLYVAEGVSFMLGAYFVKKLPTKSPYTVLLAFSLLIGLSQLILYFTTIPFISIVAFIVFGFSVGSFFPTAATIFQTQVPSEFHGRFFSFRGMFDDFIYQLILLATGFLLDTVGFHHMTVLFGALSLLTTLSLLMTFRRKGKESVAA